MAPPSFSDLGKDASDLYNKDFTFGSVKAELKTKAAPFGTELRVAGTHDIETTRLACELEAKHVFKEHGLTFTKKVKSGSIFTGEVAIDDRLVQGLKNAFEVTLDPAGGKHVARVKNSLKRQSLNAACDLEFKGSFPAVASSGVFGYQNWFLGTNVGYDTGRQKLTKLGFGAAYQTKDFSLYAGADPNTGSFTSSAYQRVSANLEAAARLQWSLDGHAADFGAAAKYNLGGGSWAKARLDSRSQLGTSVSFPVRRGFRLTMCGNLDLKNLNGGGHQLGLAVNFEP